MKTKNLLPYSFYVLVVLLGLTASFAMKLSMDTTHQTLSTKLITADTDDTVTTQNQSNPNYQFLSCANITLDDSWTYNTVEGFNRFVCKDDTYLGNYQAGESISRQLIGLAEHKSIRLRWKLARLDNWTCDDQFVVIADNNNTVYKMHIAPELNNSCGSEGYDGTVTLTTNFNHTNTSLTLIFTSTLNETRLTKSWGICGVEVYLQNCTIDKYSGEEACLVVCPEGTVKSQISHQCIKESNYTPFELYGNFNTTGGWNSKSLQIISYNGSTILKSISPANSLLRAYTGLPNHKSITLRLRLHTIERPNTGLWSGKSIIITSSNNQEVLKHTFSELEYRRDISEFGRVSDVSIEISFAHTSSKLEIQLQSDLEVDSDAFWGISDVVLFANPCAQDEVKETENDTCIPYSQSVIYYLKSTNQLDLPSDIIWSAVPEFPQRAFNELTRFNLPSPNWISNYKFYVPKISPDEDNNVGPFGVNHNITRVFTALPDHLSLTISFRLYIFDDWQNESIYLIVNGVERYRRSFSNSDDFKNKYLWNYLNPSENDGFVDVEISFNSSIHNTKITFGSTITEVNPNAYWALQNVLIYASPCFVDYIYDPDFGCAPIIRTVGEHITMFDMSFFAPFKSVSDNNNWYFLNLPKIYSFSFDRFDLVKISSSLLNVMVAGNPTTYNTYNNWISESAYITTRLTNRPLHSSVILYTGLRISPQDRNLTHKYELNVVADGKNVYSGPINTSQIYNGNNYLILAVEFAHSSSGLLIELSIKGVDVSDFRWGLDTGLYFYFANCPVGTDELQQLHSCKPHSEKTLQDAFLKIYTASQNFATNFVRASVVSPPQRENTPALIEKKIKSFKTSHQKLTN